MNERTTLSPWGRLLLAAIGLAGGVLLATAWRLSPDARGYGTHEQLGLAACGFTRLTGWPCPTCGMTTAWAHVLDGQLRAALVANAGGVMLCLVAVAATPWAIASAVVGRCLWMKPTTRLVLWIGTAWLAITLFDWARRLAAGF